MISTKSSGKLSVDVFDLNGNRVATLYNGSLSATHTFDMAKMPKGGYIVYVKGAGISATQPVKVR